MKQGITRALSTLLLGGIFALWGCEKVALTELSPKVYAPMQAAQQATAPISLKEAAWKRFVEQVERGERVDPLGQYVSKATRLDRANGAPTLRPKVEPEARWYQKVTRRSASGTTTTMTAMTDGECDPLAIECVGTGGGGGDGIFQTFVSSEGVAPYSGPDNPNGYIHDLKISFDRSPQGPEKDHYNIVKNAFTGEAEGYTRLPADLNKGVGGPFIYLSFTRNPTKVRDGGMGLTTGSTTPLTGIDANSVCCWYSSIVTPPGFGYITSAVNFAGIESIDLNVDAGGRYIYSFQSKDSSQGTPIEVGVLSGNSANILPPSGWIKRPQDLNEGAGGDFIYFCYKRR